MLGCDCKSKSPSWPSGEGLSRGVGIVSMLYTLPDGIRQLRADKALALSHPEHSRVAFHRAFDAGLVLLRGKAISRDASVTGGDTLEFSFPDTKPAELKAVDIPLEVIFEDKHLLAVNKTSGMIVHPGAGTGEDTLVHALLAHCAGSLSGIGGVERPGIVHRLDRETSGIILVAKSDAAHRGLSEQFSERALQKEYLALVAGAPALMSGSIRKAIGRNTTHRHKMAVVEAEEGGCPLGDPGLLEAHLDNPRGLVILGVPQQVEPLPGRGVRRVPQLQVGLHQEGILGLKQREQKERGKEAHASSLASVPGTCEPGQPR